MKPTIVISPEDKALLLSPALMETSDDDITCTWSGTSFDVRMPFIKTEPNSNESPTNVPMASVSPLGHALPQCPPTVPQTETATLRMPSHKRKLLPRNRPQPQCSTAAIMSVQLPVLHHAAPTQPPTSTAPVSNIGTAPTSNVSAQPPTSTTPVTNTGVAPPNNVAAQPQAVAAASASNRGHRGTTETVEGATIDSGRKGFNKINGSFGSGMTERTDAIRMVTDDDDSDQL